MKNFSVCDLTPNPDYPGTLRSKICWSKNVIEEREAVNQIIIGADHHAFLPIVALGIHLDHVIWKGNLKEESRLFRTNKKFASNWLKEEDFPLLFDDLLLDTHSMRKCSSSYVRYNSCSRDDVKIRGRRKRIKRMVDICIDVALPYLDTKVTSI